MNPNYIEFTRRCARVMGLFEEAAKRIKYTPFDDQTFYWKLIFEPTPMFFALRQLLREGGHRFELATPDLIETKHPVEGAIAIITPWTTTSGPYHVLVRQKVLPRSELPLYYESGDWICPQQNFLFDWSTEQAWAFLIDRNLITVEDVCALRTNSNP